MQLYGGDGMAFLNSRDPLEMATMAVLAERVAELDASRIEALARAIRNEIAEMLNSSN